MFRKKHSLIKYISLTDDLAVVVFFKTKFGYVYPFIGQIYHGEEISTIPDVALLDVSFHPNAERLVEFEDITLSADEEKEKIETPLVPAGKYFDHPYVFVHVSLAFGTDIGYERLSALSNSDFTIPLNLQGEMPGFISSLLVHYEDKGATYKEILPFQLDTSFFPAISMSALDREINLFNEVIFNLRVLGGFEGRESLISKLQVNEAQFNSILDELQNVDPLHDQLIETHVQFLLDVNLLLIQPIQQSAPLLEGLVSTHDQLLLDVNNLLNEPLQQVAPLLAQLLNTNDQYLLDVDVLLNQPLQEVAPLLGDLIDTHDQYYIEIDKVIADPFANIPSLIGDLEDDHIQYLLVADKIISQSGTDNGQAIFVELADSEMSLLSNIQEQRQEMGLFLQDPSQDELNSILGIYDQVLIDFTAMEQVVSQLPLASIPSLAGQIQATEDQLLLQFNALRQEIVDYQAFPNPVDADQIQQDQAALLNQFDDYVDLSRQAAGF